MLLFKFRYLITPILFLFILSCSKVNVGGPAGPKGPYGPIGDSSITGPIYGKVFLYDSLGDPMSDNSGASVVFENSSPLIRLLTQADGSFSVSSAPAGVYDISISKDGYGPMKLFHFEHTGGINASQTGRIELGRQLSDRDPCLGGLIFSRFGRLRRHHRPDAGRCDQCRESNQQ
ncbi:MAG: carboxypeptidase-like regulatory domain-containing protein [Bacteroidota bacterium]|nr:carboxypeptidase-like regulatory domain-containing protein [Bacteroidota bacterium]